MNENNTQVKKIKPNFGPITLVRHSEQLYIQIPGITLKSLLQKIPQVDEENDVIKISKEDIEKLITLAKDNDKNNGREKEELKEIYEKLGIAGIIFAGKTASGFNIWTVIRHGKRWGEISISSNAKVLEQNKKEVA